MTRFFTDRHGDYFALHLVRSVRSPPLRDKNAPVTVRFWTVMMDGGAKVEVPDYAIDDVIGVPSTMIPAQPGTYLLGGVEADDEDVAAVWQTPVIAWSIGTAGEVKPWTPEGQDDGGTTPSPVLMPNGMVIEQQTRSYRTLEEWFETEREVRRASRAKAAS